MDLQIHKTPYYGYDMNILRQTLAQCQDSALKYGYHVHYALKANFNKKILEEIHNYAIGVDCVSGGEIRLARELNFGPDQIVFAGVGKTDLEISNALKTGIFCFNVESFPELEVINLIAARLGKIAPIALRINPDVDAGTHHYITTGLSENKFGMDAGSIPQILEYAKNADNLDLMGLHFHIGSSINDLSTFKALCLKVNQIKRNLENKGFTFKILNMGGGLGIDYQNPVDHLIPNFSEYFGIFNRFLEVLPGQKIHFELGRSLVGQCGTLFTKVLYVKKGTQTNFLIVDAGMNDLLRPSLYQAYHHIDKISMNSTEMKEEVYDVVGPVCESSDFFRRGIKLPTCVRGDILAIRSVGAYGEVMSSPYNLREKALAYYFS